MFGVGCLALDQVTEHDVSLAIKKLKSKPIAGPQYTVKGCADIISQPLLFLDWKYTFISIDLIVFEYYSYRS